MSIPPGSNPGFPFSFPPPMNPQGLSNSLPTDIASVIGQLRGAARDPNTGEINPALVQTIRAFAAFAIPQKTVFEDINWTLTIDPKATNLIKLQQKNCVEQIHYWLVKEYDFNIDTCMKIIAFVMMFLTWGITYFVAIGAAMILDCMQPEPVTQEVRGLMSATLIDPSRATTLPF